MSLLSKTRGFVNGFVRHQTLSPSFPRVADAAPTRFPMAIFSSSTATSPPSSTTNNEQRLFPEEINVLYDSKCNVCKPEMDWLVSRDIRLHGPDNRRLRLTDLEDDAFDETDPRNGGIDYATGMAAIYAVRHDGRVYKGVPVFEIAYDQVGLGWIWKVQRFPAVKRFLEWGYEMFANNRTKVTRGASLEELLALRAAQQQEAERCDSSSCSTKTY